MAVTYPTRSSKPYEVAGTRKEISDMMELFLRMDNPLNFFVSSLKYMLN